MSNSSLGIVMIILAITIGVIYIRFIIEDNCRKTTKWHEERYDKLYAAVEDFLNSITNTDDDSDPIRAYRNLASEMSWDDDSDSALKLTHVEKQMKTMPQLQKMQVTKLTFESKGDS